MGNARAIRTVTRRRPRFLPPSGATRVASYQSPSDRPSRPDAFRVEFPKRFGTFRAAPVICVVTIVPVRGVVGRTPVPRVGNGLNIEKKKKMSGLKSSRMQTLRVTGNGPFGRQVVNKDGSSFGNRLSPWSRLGRMGRLA